MEEDLYDRIKKAQEKPREPSQLCIRESCGEWLLYNESPLRPLETDTCLSNLLKKIAKRVKSGEIYFRQDYLELAIDVCTEEAHLLMDEAGEIIDGLKELERENGRKRPHTTGA